MPQYVKGEEKKYFPTVIAALIVGAIAIAGFIYSVVKSGDKIEIGANDTNVVKLNPGADTPTPKTAPNVIPPTNPPPSK